MLNGLRLPLGSVTAEAILAFPRRCEKDNPVPLIITQHGIGSSPETPFALDNDAYHAYARELLKAGFAVLSPDEFTVHGAEELYRTSVQAGGHHTARN
jgi:dienelactone hydrolase